MPSSVAHCKCYGLPLDHGPPLKATALRKQILNNLQAWGGDWEQDLSKLRGQSYDGALSMSGKFRGVPAHLIAAHYKLPTYVHCVRHLLYFVFTFASEQHTIRTMVLNVFAEGGQVQTYDCVRESH